MASTERIRGKVKWFNSEKRFGFISVTGRKDVFVHEQQVEANSLPISEGDEVEFNVQENAKGPSASNVVRL